MKTVSSRNILAMTQELSAILATEPHISAHVQSFNLAGQERQSDLLQILARAISISFPDYDFSGVEHRQFREIESAEAARGALAWTFESALPEGGFSWNRIYQCIETEISPAVCHIFAYEPDCGDAFSASGAIWSICYIFVNMKQGKALLFHLREGAQDFDADNDMEERYGFCVF
jgi:hypothetical protein